MVRDLSPQLLRQAVAVRPSPRQLAWQQVEFYAFFHFGINTFTGREWGDGTEDPALFCPEQLDVRQWVQAARSAGMRGVILTCKHHDGFCLWPSAYTEHSVRSSPWMEGKGDVVRRLSDACREAGLKFGVYLSPWDRHDPRYGTGRPYDDYYAAQLTELATQYGEIFCFWFDGACGEGKNGKKQQYDWERYYNVVRQYQPGAVISVCGPDVRWCGNEAGHCRPSEWSVVPAALQDAGRTQAHSQQKEDRAFARWVDPQDQDLGSREAIRTAGPLAWYPAEVDTSIRPGWFYHPEEDGQVRTAAQLEQIYLEAVGGNAALLLNIPPAPSGRIAPPDCAALAQLGERLRCRFAQDLTAQARITAGDTAPGHPAGCLLDGREDTWWQAAPGCLTPCLRLDFERPCTVQTLLLGEYLPQGQRVESGEVWADGRCLAKFTVVGHKRICTFAPVVVRSLEVRITASRAEPCLWVLAVYK